MARCEVDGELLLRFSPLAGQIGPDRGICQRHHVNGWKGARPVDDVPSCRDKHCPRCRVIKRARRIS